MIEPLSWQEKQVGTKDNIEYIKRELTQEEKFLESLLKVERFYKRYKRVLLGGVAIAVVAVASYLIYETKKERDLRLANEALVEVLRHPQNKEALELLRTRAPGLYTLYLYRRAVEERDVKTLKKLASQEDPVVSDLARYHLAAFAKDHEKLRRYLAIPDGIYRDLGLLESGYLYKKEGRIESGDKELASIPKESVVRPFGSLLRHYGVAR